jgi:3-dehydroquinate synthase class II
MCAHGQHKAVYGAKLARDLGLTNEKSVQVLATELRREGYLVGAHDGGFFLCITEDEAQTYLESLKARIAGAQITISAFSESMKRRWDSQGSLF